MATYRPRQDGLIDLQLDDGTSVPVAWSPEQAEINGLSLLAEPSAIDPSAGLPAGSSAGPGLSTLHVEQPPPPPQIASVGAVQPGGMGTPAQPGPAPAPASKGPLVSITAPQGPAPAPAPQPSESEQEAQRLSRAVFEESMAPAGRSGPARMAKVAMTREGAMPRSEADDEALADARIDRATAEQNLGDNKEQALGTQAALQSQQLKVENEALLAERERGATIERDYQSRLAEIDARRERARALDEKGTPRERVWQSKGWFGRILATFALALGHLGTAQGGPNLAKQMLDEEVADEEKRQADLLESAPEHSALKELMDVHRDRDVAHAELRLRLKEQALSRAQYWATRAQASEVAPMFDKWLAELNYEVAAERDALNRLVGGKVSESYRLTGGGGGGRPSVYTAIKRSAETAENVRTLYNEKEPKRSLDVEERQQGRKVRLPGTDRWVWTGKSEEAAEAKNIFDETEAGKKALDELIAIAEQRALHKTWFPDRGRVDALALKARSSIAQLYNFKQLTENEASTVDPVAGFDVNKFLKLDAQTISGLKKTREIIHEIEQRRMNRLSETPDMSKPVVPAGPPARKAD